MKFFIKNIKDQVQNPGINKKNVSFFFILWACLFLLNFIAKLYVNEYNESSQNSEKILLDTPFFFPFSVYSFNINYRILYSIIPLYFLINFLFTTKITPLKAILSSIAIVILSNYANSGYWYSFHSTLTWGNVTYYYEALKIQNWIQWLRDFNFLHPNMLSHSASHPPGPTLLIYFLSPDGDHYPALIMYLLLSLTNITILYTVMNVLKIEIEKLLWIVLLFVAMPSFNLYSILCADSMFLHFFNLFLLGIVFYHSEKYRWLSIIYLPVSLIIVGFLTFAVTFLFALGAFYSLYLFKKGDKKFIWIYLYSISSFFIFYLGFEKISGFNWMEAFFSASNSENPNGFALLSNPLNYFMTRIESIWEFLIFAGIPITLLLPKIRIKTYIEKYPLLIFSLIITLLMLASGAFRTGETGRVLIFIYPYFIFLFKDLSIQNIKFLFVLCLVQSLLMQSLGYWIW